MAAAASTTASAAVPRQRPIDLFKGWPNPKLLPPRQLDEASGFILSHPDTNADVLFYGPDEGYLPLRKEIAKWLSQFYRDGAPIPYERICVSGGASQNLACILQTFTDPIFTRHVWMVAPTYYLACRIFTDSGFDGRMRAVPEDVEGVDLDFLRRGLEQSEKNATAEGNLQPQLKAPKPWRKIYKHIIYAVPTFANPSGRVMSLGHRQGLVRLAREYDALIVTDDVYDMLQWPSEPTATPCTLDRAVQPRIVDVDRDLDGGPRDKFGNAVSNGSFSKIIAPGCRTGWAEGTEAFAYGLSQTGSSRSGGAPSQLVASFIYEMLATGTLQKHIYQDLQPAYAKRYHTMMRAIRQFLLPLGVTTPEADKSVAGGYFVWLTLPEPLDAATIWRKAIDEENVTTITGPKFKVEGDEDSKETRFDRDLRLCYSWDDVDVLEEGVRRLSRLIERELKSAQETHHTEPNVQ